MSKIRMSIWLLPLLALLLGGCIDNRPKILGSGKKFDFSAFDTGTQSLFKFNFALRGDTTTRNGRATTEFFMQGASNTKAGMIGTCNLAGTGCVCKYLQSDGTTSAGPDSTSTNVSFDERGNYFRCNYTGTTPTAATFLRIENIAGTVTSGNILVDTTGTGGTLSLPKLIGTDLSVALVRHVFRYSCEYNFLQKHGTTTQSFDCIDQPVSCDPDNDTQKNFCRLVVRFPFFLFADTFASNFGQKISDRIYNGGGGEGKICGLQIKQINCADGDGTGNDGKGTPKKQFGLYGEQTGIWDTNVSLGAGPDLAPSSFGFAARVSATTGACPPGLVKRVFWQAGGATGIVTTDITPAHNFTSLLKATEVASPDVAATPSPFVITKFSGAHCNPSQVPTACQFPQSQVVTPVKSIAYDKTDQTEFCVIPDTVLP